MQHWRKYKLKYWWKFRFLREYDTVARADNYFAEYRMLFSRRHSNTRDIFRGSCIDIIKSWLHKNFKAPASSWIMSLVRILYHFFVMQTITVLFHLFHSPVVLPFHPIQGKRRERLHDVLPIKIHCRVILSRFVMKNARFLFCS